MIVKNNDLLFLLASILLAVGSAIAIANPDPKVGIYSVVGFLGLIAVLAIVIKPSFGAIVLIIAIFTNISSQLTDAGYPGIIKPLVAVAFGAVVLRNYYALQFPADRKRTTLIEIFLVAYFLSMAASYLVAKDKSKALDAVVDLGKDMVIIYTILFSLRTWASWKQSVWVLIITTAVLCLFGLYHIVTADYSQDFFGLNTVQIEGVQENTDATSARISGPVHDPNFWAQIILVAMSLLLFQIIHEKNIRLKILSVFMMILLGVVLLNTYSRGGYLSLIIVVALTFLVYERTIISPAMATLGVLVFLVVLVYLPANFRSRFESLLLVSSSNGSGVYQDGSLQGRSSVMLAGLAMFGRNPLLGVGAGNFQANYQEYNQILGIEFEYGERDPHSLYTQILSETGILGALSFSGLVYFLITGLSKTIKSIKNISYFKPYVPWVMSLQVSIIGYLVSATFLHNAYIRYFWILFALAITSMQLIDEELSSMSALDKERALP